MTIEWILVVFTALTGCGGWLAACVGLDTLLRKTSRSLIPASIVAICFLGVGGVVSVFHLQHAEHILYALSHPTSGIFVEAVLVGLCALALLVLIILAARKASRVAQQVVGVLAGVLGLLLAFMAGHSYMMPAIPQWNTVLLPLGYLLTAAPAGVAAYLAVLAARREDDAALVLYGKVLLVAGIAGILGAVCYGAGTGVGGTVTTLWVLAAVSSAVAGCCGLGIAKKPQQALVLAIVALVVALAGAILFRVVMWLSGVATVNFFKNL